MIDSREYGENFVHFEKDNICTGVGALPWQGSCFGVYI